MPMQNWFIASRKQRKKPMIFLDNSSYRENMLSVSLLIGALSFPSLVQALPDGAQVVGGAAVINQSADTFTINQSSQQVSINYNNFNIAAGETVNFIQPGTNSIALNQIVGNNASEIFGSLNANGQVFLLNPNGILFAPGSQINVGGLFASTLSISDDDFFNQHYKFESTGAAGIVQNYGQLQGGYVALVSPRIENHGSIVSDNINLHAADSVLVSFSPGIHIETLSSSYDATIENKGLISAGGGEVILTAASHNELLETAVNNTGVIEAGSLVEKEGRVFLVAEDQGDVINSGEITVSGIENNSHGGEVLLEGERVAQLGEIHADGLGQGDGGRVNLYGSDVVALASDSVTTANAGEIGHGGEVIALSPDTTLFRQAAVIEATAGDLAGNGGYVDVSGFQHVEAFGLVDVSAVLGEHGTFVIDPTNITIGAVDANMTAGPIFQATATGAMLDISTLNAALETGAAVEVRTDTGFDAGEAGNITVNSVVINYDSNNDGTSGSSLSLIADGSIIFSANAQIIDAIANDASMDLNLSAGSNIEFFDNTLVELNGGNFVANAGGLFRVDSSSAGGNSLINTGTGTISITTGGNLRLGGLLTTNATSSAITLNIGNDITDGGNTYTDIDAANGQVNINGGGTVALETDINQLSLDTARDIDITNATALDFVGGNVGANLSLVTTAGDITVSGDVNLDGALGSTFTLNANQAINMTAGTVISDQVTGGDDVDITLTAGTNLVMVDTSSVQSQGGTITATTTAGNMTVSNLVSTSALATAIDLNVTGDLIDGGDTDLRDLDAAFGGVDLTVTGNIMTGISNLELEANTINVNLSGGNANLSVVAPSVISPDINITGISGAGSLRFQNLAGDITVSGDIDLDGSNGNTYAFNAVQDIILNAGVNIVDLTTGTVDDTTITLTADRHISMSDTSVIDATGGIITVIADNDGDRVGNATLNDLFTTSSASNAINVFAEDIIDSSLQAVDLSAVNGRVNLTVTGDVFGGPGNNTDILAAELSITSLNNGDVFVKQNTSNADLVLVSATGINNFTFEVLNATMILPDGGINVTGDLHLIAQDIIDSDRTINLSSQALLLDVSASAGNTVVNSNISTLDSNFSGVGDFSLINSSALEIADVLPLLVDGGALDGIALENNGGSISVQTTAGDVTLSDSIDLDGSDGNTYTFTSAQNIILNTGVSIVDLTTATPDGTNIVLSADNAITMLANSVINAGTGLINITADADSNLIGNATLGDVITSSSANNAITISAQNIADASVDGTDIVALNGRVNLIATGNMNGGDGSIDINANEISINAINNGNVSISQLTASNDVNIISATNINNFTLAVSNGDAVIPDAGLNVTGNLSIGAQDLIDSDRTVNLAGQNLGLTLSAAAGDVAINSTLTSLDATMSGANRNLSLTETDDITINSLTGINDFTLTAAAGTVTIPDAGLNVSGNLNFTAQDIVDADRTINFTATDLLMDITAAAGDMSINTSVDRINIDFTGASGSTDLSITESNALEIIDLGVNPPYALSNSDGNITVQVLTGDLIVNDGVIASDLTADAVRSGMIDLAVDSGDILIGNLRSTTIDSVNSVDQNAGGGLDGNQVAVRIHNPDTGDLNTDIIVGDGSGNDVSINVEGGDFQINNSTTVPLTGGNTRDAVIAADVTIEAYNNIGDPLNGTSTLQGVTNNGNLLVHSGREISATSGDPVPVDTTDVENAISSIIQGETETESDPESVTETAVSQEGNSSPAQQMFSQVFQACDASSGKYSKSQCSAETELQNFLQSLLIGGQLPKVSK